MLHKRVLQKKSAHTCKSFFDQWFLSLFHFKMNSLSLTSLCFVLVPWKEWINFYWSNLQHDGHKEPNHSFTFFVLPHGLSNTGAAEAVNQLHKYVLLKPFSYDFFSIIKKDFFATAFTAPSLHIWFWNNLPKWQLVTHSHQSFFQSCYKHLVIPYIASTLSSGNSVCSLEKTLK
jgi:hypothetical protein